VSANCEGPVDASKLMEPEEVMSTPQVRDALVDAAFSVSPNLAVQYSVSRSTACYLPICATGLPLVGPVQAHAGIFVGCGLSCWGIMNGPITGKIVAQLALGKPTSVPFKSFLPK